MRICIFLIAFLFAGNYAFSQIDSVAVSLSSRVANRLKDSLDLTINQRDSIYEVNLEIHHEKAAVWALYNGSDSLVYYLQKIENKRDTLYRDIIVPEEKYLLYIDRKRILVSSN